MANLLQRLRQKFDVPLHSRVQHDEHPSPVHRRCVQTRSPDKRRHRGVDRFLGVETERRIPEGLQIGPFRRDSRIQQEGIRQRDHQHRLIARAGPVQRRAAGQCDGELGVPLAAFHVAGALAAALAAAVAGHLEAVTKVAQRLVGGPHRRAALVVRHGGKEDEGLDVRHGVEDAANRAAQSEDVAGLFTLCRVAVEGHVSRTEGENAGE